MKIKHFELIQDIKGRTAVQLRTSVNYDVLYCFRSGKNGRMVCVKGTIPRGVNVNVSFNILFKLKHSHYFSIILHTLEFKEKRFSFQNKPQQC